MPEIAGGRGTVWAAHRGEFPCSERTFYRYVDAGFLDFVLDEHVRACVEGFCDAL
jgi:hypothetical protein